jgi:hypothetical protein
MGQRQSFQMSVFADEMRHFCQNSKRGLLTPTNHAESIQSKLAATRGVKVTGKYAS